MLWVRLCYCYKLLLKSSYETGLNLYEEDEQKKNGLKTYRWDHKKILTNW